jgi:CRP-like cAMP-binding protein
VIKTLQKGEVFGEYGFFTGNARQLSAFSKGFSKVFKVQRMTFMHLLMEFPEDQEKF